MRRSTRSLTLAKFSSVGFRAGKSVSTCSEQSSPDWCLGVVVLEAIRRFKKRST